MRNRRLIAVLLLLLVLGLGSRAVSRGQVRPNDPNVRLLAEAIARVQSQYVEELEVEELTHNAIRGMLSALDPYSVYLDVDDFTNLRIGTSGNYEGLGIHISIRNGFLTVIAPIEGAPAYKAGIIAGDRIVEIDGEATESMTLDDAVHLMRGARATEVDLTIARGRDGRMMDFTVARGVIELKSVPYAFKDESGVGYVRVTAFQENTARDLRRAIDALEEEGIDGLVLDLRGNPGGLLDQAVQVSECFLPSGKVIVETRGRHDRDDREYGSRSRSTYDDLPLVVMVDQGSASASEIVAGAIQDWDAGVVLGRPSFGKASVQTVVNLSNGAAIKLTTAKYYTPSGRLIQRDDRREEPRVTAAIDDEGEEHSIDDTEVFYTSMGRPIKGGGGISPDLDVEGTEYTDLLYDIERAGLFQEHAIRFLEGRSDWEPLAQLPAGELDRFRAFADTTEDLEISDEAFDESIELITRGIRREVARRAGNDQAAWQVRLEGDPQYQDAIELFDEAPTLQKMFEVADARQDALETAQ